jgi:hypothetical protein
VGVRSLPRAGRFGGRGEGGAADIGRLNPAPIDIRQRN